jgi:hypothetical protein
MNIAYEKTAEYIHPLRNLSRDPNLRPDLENRPRKRPREIFSPLHALCNASAEGIHPPL